MPNALRHLALSTSAPVVRSGRAAPPRLIPGTKRTSFGPYELRERIGAGSIAETFLASVRGNADFERHLVIKRILPSLANDEQFVRMFIEEASLAARLRHPNVVQTYDLGAVGGHYFMAMEYVDGRDLLTVLSACGHRGIGFPTVVALYIVMEILRGLHYAHRLRSPDGTRLSIVHRDLCPSNVLLSFEGEVKIGDFALAKAVTRERTTVGVLKGKPGYISPEQARAGPIDHRADIFAIGILLYELITGHRLFPGQHDAAILDHARKITVDPPLRYFRADLDEELEQIVQRTLAASPGARFESCLALHDALLDYLARSKVMVGPFQLARFMRNLFAGDPREVTRRVRAGLSPIDPLDDEVSVPRHEEISDRVMPSELEELERLEQSTVDAAPRLAGRRERSRTASASSLGWSFSHIGPPPDSLPAPTTTGSGRKRRMPAAVLLIIMGVIFSPAPLHFEPPGSRARARPPKEATNVRSSPVVDRREADEPSVEETAGPPSNDEKESTLLIQCPVPVDVHIHGLKKHAHVHRLRQSLAPGTYLIAFRRNGRLRGQIEVNLAAGQRLTVACP